MCEQHRTNNPLPLTMLDQSIRSNVSIGSSIDWQVFISHPMLSTQSSSVIKCRRRCCSHRIYDHRYHHTVSGRE